MFSCDVDARRWCVARCEPLRCPELVQRLHRFGVGVWMPMMLTRRRSRWKRQAGVVSVPAISGLVFVDANEVGVVRGLDRAAQIPRTTVLTLGGPRGHEPLVMADASLDGLRETLAEIDRLVLNPKVEEPWHDPGVAVGVRSGPMEGWQGIVRGRQGHNQVVEFVKSGWIVKISPWLLVANQQ
jgi:hypothetical protein